MKISYLVKEGNKTGVLISYIELCKYFQIRKFTIYSVKTTKNRTEITLIDDQKFVFIYINFIEEE